MKSARRAAAFCAVLTAGFLLARADDAPHATILDSGTPLKPPPELAPAPPVGGGGNFSSEDPEAAIIESVAIRDELVHQQMINSYRAAQQKQAYDNDWMLRDYTANVQRQGLAPAADQNAPDPSGGVGLADPTALLAPIDPLLPPADNAPKPPDRPAAPRADDSTDSVHSDSTPFLQPLLPPLNGPNAPTTVTRLDAWGSNTVAVDPATDSSTPELVVPGVQPLRPDDVSSESSLDVPGLTAERQTLGDAGDLELSDQQMETATENADNRARRDFLLPTVPVANNDSDFFKKQSEALAPPPAPTARLAPNGSIPLGPPHAPEPTMKVPVTVGIRSHVADPFDLIGGHRDSDGAGY